jgi:hypothetical protein
MSRIPLAAIFIGLIGLVIGIFAMTPYNNIGPYAYIIGGGLPFALLLCGLGIFFILMGLWLRQHKPK